MKIGFIFLTVNEIKNIDIWHHWFANASCDYEIFIHSKNKYNDYPEHSVFKNKLIKAHVPTKWGRLAKAQMALWQESYNKKCDYSVLLSDTSLPLNHFDFLHFKLESNYGKSYVHYQKPWWGRTSYKRRINNLSFKLMGAPQWIIMYRDHTLPLINSHKIHDELVKKCLHPDDEAYPSTVLKKSGLLNDEHIIKKLTTFTDWKRKTKDKKHPYTFKSIDTYNFDLLKEKSKNFIFARKFDELIKDDKKKIMNILNERLFNIDNGR